MFEGSEHQIAGNILEPQTSNLKQYEPGTKNNG